MARRKRQFLDDGDDSDSSVDSEDEAIGEPGLEDHDPDLRAERELFENPYNRNKRRRVNGKDDATYGVFGDDSEDDGFKVRREASRKRRDWAKAPAFVSGNKVHLKKSMDENSVESEKSTDDEQGDGEQNDEDQNEDSNSDGETMESKPPSPRVPREEYEEDGLEQKPKFGGIGMGKKVETDEPSQSSAHPGFGKGGIGSSKGGVESSESGVGSSIGGIGSSKGGIGSSKGGIGSSSGGIGSSRLTTAADGTNISLPSSFGASRTQRSFVRDGSASAGKAAAPLSTSEQLHFNKLGGTFGARMLAKMGWQAGTGLGVEGTGIVTPVEQKLRPKNIGIAFKGFKEKTEQSKAEARRRGEAVSDDEGEKRKRRSQGKGKGSDQAARTDAWKKPKKSKLKVHHKTYEEIIAEAGAEHAAPGIGKIIDATGATLREVSSLADVSLASWTPSTDPLRIPEVRHNLRLIADACKGDLDGLAKEAKALEDRKKWIRDEDARLRRKVVNEAELIKRLQGVHLVVDDINAKAKEMMSSDYEPTLETFSVPIEKLVEEFPEEYDRYRLDEIVVAAIAPTLRRMMALWQPLEEPTAFTSTLRRWKRALKTSNNEDKAGTQLDVYGTATVIHKPSQIDSPMTPFESLIWNIWMPRVRSCINNQWSPQEPQPAVRLYEAWAGIIPPFVRDNVFDQLILPKVSSAVANWNARKDTVSLQSIVFPWLPHVGLRFEEVVNDSRRKVKSMLRSWMPNEGVPKDFVAWKDIFDASEWEAMLLKYIVPKLGMLLREDFKVNPRDQNMEPLQQALLWDGVLRQSIIGQLLETEFFPKWLDILYVWLVQPSPSFEEIAQWYSFWKGSFPENIQSLAAVKQGFNRGLQMMDQAIELGQDRPTKLTPPEHRERPESPTAFPIAGSRKEAARARPSRSYEVTFRSIVEEYVTEHNLFFVSAGKVHEKTRIPLFRVAKTVDGKGGLLVYLLDDAVWASDGDDYRAITLADMVLRATKGNK